MRQIGIVHVIRKFSYIILDDMLDIRAIEVLKTLYKPLKQIINSIASCKADLSLHPLCNMIANNS